jgi:hypothetical protein
VTPRSPRIGSSTHLRDSGQLLRTDVMPGVRLAPAARTRNPGRESPGRLAWIGNSKGPFRTANFAERAETLAALTQGAALPAASVPAGKHHQHGNQISRGCAGGVRATSDASSGRDLSPAVFSKCARMRAMTESSSMLALIQSLRPQRAQPSISTPNTRLSRRA